MPLPDAVATWTSRRERRCSLASASRPMRTGAHSRWKKPALPQAKRSWPTCSRQAGLSRGTVNRSRPKPNVAAGTHAGAPSMSSRPPGPSAGLATIWAARAERSRLKFVGRRFEPDKAHRFKIATRRICGRNHGRRAASEMFPPSARYFAWLPAAAHARADWRGPRRRARR
jgi:hypothetical protein